MSVYRVSSNKSSVNNFPTVRPTLDLDFANSKTLDPRITFTRSSGGSYVGADGLIKLAGVNEARFDHDPVTGESLGLLVEEARTNLSTYSNSFSTVGNWTPVSTTCVFTQNVTGPDGVVNGAWTIDDQFTGSDGAGFEQSLSITPSASTNYCLSVFVKKGTATYFDFFAFFTGSSTKGTFFRYNFSTDTISVSSADGGGISPTIFGKIEYPNGWYRLYFVVNDANSGLNNTLQYRIYPASRETGLTGTTLFYGAQLEEGAFPTSYIPTEASTRTRAADNASITGKNFRDFYRQDEGTFVTTSRWFVKRPGTPINYIFRVSNLSNPNNTIGIWNWNGSDSFIVYILINNQQQTDLFFSEEEAGTTVIDMNTKGLTYKVNDSAFSVNGKLKIDNNVNNIPTDLNNLFISQGGSKSQHIKILRYYPKRLPDAQLQALTK